MNMIAIQTLPAPDAEGLTLAEVLANIPNDPASLFIYLLLIGSGVLIWRGSRRKDNADGSSR